MKIKLLANICGPEGTYKAGKVLEKFELSEKLINALIKDGFAEEVKEEVREIKENVTEIKENVTEIKKKQTPPKKKKR